MLESTFASIRFSMIFKPMRPITSKIVFVFALYILAFPMVFADDAHSKSVISQSKARVIAPITLENTSNQGLDFGVIALGTTNASILIAPAATVPINVPTGNSVVLTSSVQTAAKFTVSGEDAKSYVITVPASTTISNGAQSLTITDFTCSNGSGGLIGTNDVFYVGATLLIPSSAVADTYQGTFSVTVAYN